MRLSTVSRRQNETRQFFGTGWRLRQVLAGLQVQLSPELFHQFPDFAEKRIDGLTAVETVYVTRAWATRRV